MPSPVPSRQLNLFEPPARRPRPQYISASRRTDLPRFFHHQFFEAWQQGRITYDGGYGRAYTVSLAPAEVLGYIFISKDYGPFIRDPRLPELLAANNALFHFTLNHCPDLEPRVAPLAERLETLARLCELAGPKRVLWRFDPVCKYTLQAENRVRTNLDAFYRLLPEIAALGVQRCYFSFMSLYRKTRHRPVRFHAFSPAEKTTLAREMLAAARAAGMALFNCCNPEIAALVPELDRAGCVDERLLAATDRFGTHRPLKPQPTREGCGCAACRDIGSYAACPHGCLYCYANPAPS